MMTEECGGIIMKYCMQCGTGIEDDALFCIMCGARQTLPDTPTEVSETKTASPPLQETTSEAVSETATTSDSDTASDRVPQTASVPKPVGVDAPIPETAPGSEVVYVPPIGDAAYEELREAVMPVRQPEKPKRSPLPWILTAVGGTLVLALLIVMTIWAIRVFAPNDAPTFYPAQSQTAATTMPADSLTTAPTTAPTTMTAATTTTTKRSDGVVDPSFEVGEGETMHVKTRDGDPLNLRKGPDTTYEKICQIPNYSSLTVYGRERGWAYVSVVHEGQTRFGWVKDDYVAAGDTNVIPYDPPLVYHVNSSDGIVLRAGAGTEYAKVDKGIPNNFELRAYERKGEWLYVYVPARDEWGWVLDDYVD